MSEERDWFAFQFMASDVPLSGEEGASLTASLNEKLENVKACAEALQHHGKHVAPQRKQVKHERELQLCADIKRIRLEGQRAMLQALHSADSSAMETCGILYIYTTQAPPLGN